MLMINSMATQDQHGYVHQREDAQQQEHGGLGQVAYITRCDQHDGIWGVWGRTKLSRRSFRIFIPKPSVFRA